MYLLPTTRNHRHLNHDIREGKQTLPLISEEVTVLDS